MILNGIFSLFIFLAVFCNSEALRCYVCNSVVHTNCDSPPSLDYLVECTDATAQPSRSIMTQRNDLEPPPESRNYTFCRKTVSSIPHQNNVVIVREAETRIVRSCGWIEPDVMDNCKWGANDGVQREMCTCRGDKCNSGSQLYLVLVIPLFVVSFSLFFS